MNELLDEMGDNIGLIRLFTDNFKNDLISQREMLEGVDRALNKLFEIQKKIGENKKG